MTRPHYMSRRTEVDQEYASCDRTCAVLLIYPTELRWQDVTTRLNIEPTKSQNTGDEIQNSEGRIRVAKKTMWAISSENHISSKDVRTHLDWLLKRLSSARRAILELQNLDVKMGVSCPWWSRSGHGGPTLWPEQMQQLVELNLECSFDVQFYPDGEGEDRGTF